MPNNTCIHRLTPANPADMSELVLVEEHGRGGAPSGVQLFFRGGNPIIGLLPQQSWQEAFDSAVSSTCGTLPDDSTETRFHVDEYWPLPKYPKLGVTLDLDMIAKVEEWLAEAKRRLAEGRS